MAPKEQTFDAPGNLLNQTVAFLARQDPALSEPHEPRGASNGHAQ